MTWFAVDVEADGPIPGDYSMICFGAVIVEPGLTRKFYGQTAPISHDFQDDVLAISGFTRDEHWKFPHPQDTMTEFRRWIKANSKNKPMFISDNNGFDWQFINYYFWHFLEDNPFGYSSTNLGSLYKGIQKTVFTNFKHLRETPHTHNPVDDAMGNAEALLKMKEMGLLINFK